MKKESVKKTIIKDSGWEIFEEKEVYKDIKLLKVHFPKRMAIKKDWDLEYTEIALMEIENPHHWAWDWPHNIEKVLHNPDCPEVIKNTILTYVLCQNFNP